MADNDFTSKLEELHSAYNEKIDNLESKINSFETAAGRPAAGNIIADEAEVKSFCDYLRKGDKSFEGKAMSATVLTEGGYTVPKQIDNRIRELLVNISPMRAVATVMSVSTPDFRIPVATTNAVSAWVGEKAARPETVAPAITEVTLSFGELYASPFVTPVLLEDSQFDVAGFVAGQVATEFARAEGAAFVTGDGVNKPKGILSVTTALTADATRAFGTVQHLVSTVTGGLNADDIKALVGTLKAGYRANARFAMTKATKTAISSLKDANGRYLLTESLAAGEPDFLVGYPVVEMEDMPEIAAGANAIVFGDFASSYSIADRVGMSMLYNPYSNAPYIAYQSRKRVGGGVTNTESYKVLKIKA